MIIGFSGPSGAGKTTLAKEAAEKFGGQFIKTDVSSVFEKNKISLADIEKMTDENGFFTRLRIQSEIMKFLNEKKRNLKWNTLSFFDRTPLDVYILTRVYLERMPFSKTEEGVRCISEFEIFCHSSIRSFGKIFICDFVSEQTDTNKQTTSSDFFSDVAEGFNKEKTDFSVLKNVSIDERLLEIEKWMR